MTRNLKRYQIKARSEVMAALRSSGSVVLQMPTGSGKTVIATDIVKRARGRVLFICHRKEIIRQTSRHFDDANIHHGVIAPGFPPSRARIMVASVQTLARRPKGEFCPKLVIWDECHHVAAKSWRKVMDAYPEAKHIGLTATPERLDGKGLEDYFSRLVCGPTTATLIKRRQLSRYRYFAPSDPDLTAAKMQAGDYRRSDIAKIMNTPVLVGDALAEYQKHASGKRAICFAVSVEASKSLAARFNQAGIPAAHVDATTPEDERDAAVAGLETGAIKVLSNVEVFTEGFDLPAIDAVILMRPTKSTQLYLQMVGRGLRTARGKDAAIIFDHAGLWLDHELPDVEREWSLDGRARQRLLESRRKHGEPMRRCPECSAVHRMVPHCPECGYEYPTGREVGEYDAQLRELRGVVPEGWAAPGTFMRLIGVGGTTVRNMMRQGLPSENGLIPVQAGKKWVLENWAPTRHPPIGVENPEDWLPGTKFCEVVGLTFGAMKTIKLLPGFRMEKNGWVHVPTGLDCVQKFYSSSCVPPKDVARPRKYEPKNHFAKRIGCSVKVVNRWRLEGLPCARNGWVHVSDGLDWVAKNGSVRNTIPAEVFRDISARYGCTESAARLWHKAGMPLPSGGNFERTDEWVVYNRASNARPLDVSDYWSYERRGVFSLRIGTSDAAISAWAKRGLPCASNGWVHIQRGLEWVRDNTSIKIPDSAWPKSDDERKAA